MRERFFAAGLVGQHAELHVDVGQLRKRVVVAAERDAAERENPFLRLGKHVRLHPANLAQLRPPLRQRRIDNELRELVIGNRLDFRDEKRRRLADLCQQILNLPDARQVFRVRAVFRELERGEVIKSLNFQIERLFKLKTLRPDSCADFPSFPFHSVSRG